MNQRGHSCCSCSRSEFATGDLVVTSGHWPEMPHVNTRYGRVLYVSQEVLVVIRFFDDEDGEWTFSEQNVKHASIVDAVGAIDG